MIYYLMKEAKGDSMKEMRNIKKDEIIILSSGEYSDYNISYLCKALEDINTEELRNEWINLHPEQTIQYSFKPYEFIDFLKEKKLVEVIPCVEWYMGSYDNISSMRVWEGPMSFT